MKQVNWEVVLSQLDDELLAEAFGDDHRKGSHLFLRRLLPLAAIVSLLGLLSLTAYAVNLFGLRDTLLKRPENTYVIIAGYQSSKEYQALTEWSAYADAQQYQIVSVEDPLYNQYGAFSEESRDVLISILEKYGLQPYTQSVAVYDRDPQSLYEAVGVANFLPESCAAFQGTTANTPGCSVQNGTTILSYTDSTLLPDGTQVNYDLVNAAKGYMPAFMGIPMDLNATQEWAYTAKDGTVVLLCSDEIRSMLLAELPHSFLGIVASAISEDTGENISLDADELEAFADLFDFPVIGQIGGS